MLMRSALRHLREAVGGIGYALLICLTPLIFAAPVAALYLTIGATTTQLTLFVLGLVLLLAIPAWAFVSAMRG
jgi:hypothetical protein